MKNVTFTSVLLENAKRQTSTTDVNSSKRNQAGGIDFANDVILVSAKNDVETAKNFEFTKTTAANTARMNSQHISQEYTGLVSDFQNLLNLQQLAITSTENLATARASVMQQLLSTNQQVATTEDNKMNATGNVAAAITALANLNVEKTNKIAAHDSRISGLNFQITAKSSKKSNLERGKAASQSTIATAQASKSALQAQLANAPEAQKVQIQTQIQALEQQINSEKANLDSKEAQLNALNEEIKALQAQLDNAKSAKAETERIYSEKIAAAEADLAQKETILTNLTAKLAELVLQQTGLTIQEASYTEKVKEAQIYEQSVNAMLNAKTNEMSDVEGKQEVADEKLETAENEEIDAQNKTKEKQGILSVTEEEQKNKKQEQNIFMA